MRSEDQETVTSDLQRADPAPRKPDAAGEDDIPQWLGERYRVTRVLGRGGMGAVYLAVDKALDCEVALKQLLVPGDAMGGLRDEVRLAQKVTHPNVCRTYDLEEISGNWLIKMEYVAGDNLARRLKEGPLPAAEAVRVAREVCHGLAVAHRQGVVHCDLKPQNVMIEAKTGRVVLMDFGIARASERAGKADDSVSGTPAYMAPEQLLGGKVDGRTDLYALGCVLYEMLTGKRAFHGPSRIEATRTQTDEPPPPLPARFPARVRRVVARLLEQDPAARPASADEVAAELAGGTRRRARWIVAAAAGVALAAAAAVIAARLRPPARAWQARLQELPSYFENSEAPAISPDGASYAYQSDREERGVYRVYVEAFAGGPARAVTPRGLSTVDPRWQRDGRAILVAERIADHVMRIPLEGGAPEVLAERARWVDDCAGRLLLGYSASPGCGRCARLALREADGKERDLIRFPSGAKLSWPRCDRAGRRAVYALAEKPVYGPHETNDLWVIAIDGGDPRRLTDDHHGSHGTFTPDGRSVVFSSARSGQWHLWELPLQGAGAPVQRTFGEGWETVPDVSPDGRFVLYNVDVTGTQLYAQPIDGGPPRQLTSTAQDLRYPRPTPDGQAIITEATPPTFGSAIVSFPSGGGDPVKLFAGALPWLTADGAEIVYVEPGTGRVRAAPRAGGAPRAITEVPGHPMALVAGADGRVHVTVARAEGWEAWGAPLAGGAAERELPAPWGMVLPAPRGGWRAAIEWRGATQRLRLLPPGAGTDDPAARDLFFMRAVAWTPDGASILYAPDSHAVHRYVVATGEDRVIADGGDLVEIAVSPDGKTLYTLQLVAHVRRELITNFAERPRPW